MSQILGTNKRKFVWKCQGVLPAEDMRHVAKHLVRLAGMTIPHGWRLTWRWPFVCDPWKPVVYPYPWESYGGTGYTLIQPLVESYIVATVSYLISDVYEDIGETEITLSTCKPERVDKERLLKALNECIGPTSLVGEL